MPGAAAYLRVLKKLSGSFSTLMCEYCGSETVAVNGIGMCSNCENMVNLARDAIEAVNPPLLASLVALRSSASAGDFDGVDGAYGSILADGGSPQMLYSAALAKIRHSNHEISLIRYDRMGFMEENSAHRLKASKLMSSARKMLAKGAYMARAATARGEGSPALTFSLFLSQLKMGNMRGAKHAVKLLGQSNDPYALSYANMLFASSMRSYAEADSYAEKLLSPQAFSINALFYLAFSLFKRGSLPEARRLLSGISGYVKSPNPALLIEAIDRLEGRPKPTDKQEKAPARPKQAPPTASATSKGK